MSPEELAKGDFQKPFTKSVLHAGAEVPSMLSAVGQNFQDERFNIYRNNIFAGLVQAIADGYPVIRRLVGDDFFRAMALEYARNSLPTSPVMMTYGASFAEFLESFEPVASLPYLPDVARLEWLYSECFHEKDSAPVTMEQVLEEAGGDIDSLVLRYHPALRLLGSRFAVLSLWNAHREDIADDQVEMPDIDAGEEILLTRPGIGVELRWLETGGLGFVRSLQQGETLGNAAEKVMQQYPDFDLQKMLVVLFESGAITGFSMQDSSSG